MIKGKENITELYSFEESLPHYYPMPRFFDTGRERAKKKLIYNEHLHVNYEWIYIKRGAVRYWIDGVCMEAHEGDFYYVQPGQVHREESIKEPMEFYYLRFYYLDFKGQMNYFIPPPGDPKKQIIKKVDREFESLFKKIYSEAVKKQQGSKQVIESLTLYMIWIIRRTLKLKNDKFTDKLQYKVEVVNKARKYLEENLEKSISLSELSSYCCISQDYLSHIFKDITGISPVQYALRIKVSEAKVLLEKTKLSISEISDKLGFQDQLYFSRVFKKIEEVSPNKYRNYIDKIKDN